MEKQYYGYKKTTHFRDFLQWTNEQNKITEKQPEYTPTQFEEDLKKWFNEADQKKIK